MENSIARPLSAPDPFLTPGSRLDPMQEQPGSSPLTVFVTPGYGDSHTVQGATCTPNKGSTTPEGSAYCCSSPTLLLGMYPNLSLNAKSVAASGAKDKEDVDLPSTPRAFPALRGQLSPETHRYGPDSESASPATPYHHMDSPPNAAHSIQSSVCSFNPAVTGDASLRALTPQSVTSRAYSATAADPKDPPETDNTTKENLSESMCTPVPQLEIPTTPDSAGSVDAADASSATKQPQPVDTCENAPKSGSVGKAAARSRAERRVQRLQERQCQSPRQRDTMLCTSPTTKPRSPSSSMSKLGIRHPALKARTGAMLTMTAPACSDAVSLLPDTHNPQIPQHAGLDAHSNTAMDAQQGIQLPQPSGLDLQPCTATDTQQEVHISECEADVALLQQHSSVHTASQPQAEHLLPERCSNREVTRLRSSPHTRNSSGSECLQASLQSLVLHGSPPQYSLDESDLVNHSISKTNSRSGSHNAASPGSTSAEQFAGFSVAPRAVDDLPFYARISAAWGQGSLPDEIVEEEEGSWNESGQELDIPDERKGLLEDGEFWDESENQPPATDRHTRTPENRQGRHRDDMDVDAETVYTPRVATRAHGEEQEDAMSVSFEVQRGDQTADMQISPAAVDVTSYKDALDQQGKHVSMHWKRHSQPPVTVSVPVLSFTALAAPAMSPLRSSANLLAGSTAGMKEDKAPLVAKRGKENSIAEARLHPPARSALGLRNQLLNQSNQSFDGVVRNGSVSGCISGAPASQLDALAPVLSPRRLSALGNGNETPKRLLPPPVSPMRSKIQPLPELSAPQTRNTHLAEHRVTHRVHNEEEETAATQDRLGAMPSPLRQSLGLKQVPESDQAAHGDQTAAAPVRVHVPGSSLRGWGALKSTRRVMTESAQAPAAGPGLEHPKPIQGHPQSPQARAATSKPHSKPTQPEYASHQEPPKQERPKTPSTPRSMVLQTVQAATEVLHANDISAAEVFNVQLPADGRPSWTAPKEQQKPAPPAAVQEIAARAAQLKESIAVDQWLEAQATQVVVQSPSRTAASRNTRQKGRQGMSAVKGPQPGGSKMTYAAALAAPAKAKKGHGTATRPGAVQTKARNSEISSAVLSVGGMQIKGRLGVMSSSVAPVDVENGKTRLKVPPLALNKVLLMTHSSPSKLPMAPADLPAELQSARSKMAGGDHATGPTGSKPNTNVASVPMTSTPSIGHTCDDIAKDAQPAQYSHRATVDRPAMTARHYPVKPPASSELKMPLSARSLSFGSRGGAPAAAGIAFPTADTSKHPQNKARSTHNPAELRRPTTAVSQHAQHAQHATAVRSPVSRTTPADAAARKVAPTATRQGVTTGRASLPGNTKRATASHRLAGTSAVVNARAGVQAPATPRTRPQVTQSTGPSASTRKDALTPGRVLQGGSGASPLKANRPSGVQTHTSPKPSGVHTHTSPTPSGVHTHTSPKPSGVHTHTSPKPSGVHTLTSPKPSGVHTHTSPKQAQRAAPVAVGHAARVPSSHQKGVSSAPTPTPRGSAVKPLRTPRGNPITTPRNATAAGPHTAQPVVSPAASSKISGGRNLSPAASAARQTQPSRVQQDTATSAGPPISKVGPRSVTAKSKGANVTKSRELNMAALKAKGEASMSAARTLSETTGGEKGRAGGKSVKNKSPGKQLAVPSESTTDSSPVPPDGYMAYDASSTGTSHLHERHMNPLYQSQPVLDKGKKGVCGTPRSNATKKRGHAIRTSKPQTTLPAQQQPAAPPALAAPAMAAVLLSNMLANVLLCSQPPTHAAPPTPAPIPAPGPPQQPKHTTPSAPSTNPIATPRKPKAATNAAPAVTPRRTIPSTTAPTPITTPRRTLASSQLRSTGIKKEPLVAANASSAAPTPGGKDVGVKYTPRGTPLWSTNGGRDVATKDAKALTARGQSKKVAKPVSGAKKGTVVSRLIVDEAAETASLPRTPKRTDSPLEKSPKRQRDWGVLWEGSELLATSSVQDGLSSAQHPPKASRLSDVSTVQLTPESATPTLSKTSSLDWLTPMPASTPDISLSNGPDQATSSDSNSSASASMLMRFSNEFMSFLNLNTNNADTQSSLSLARKSTDTADTGVTGGGGQLVLHQSGLPKSPASGWAADPLHALPLVSRSKIWADGTLAPPRSSLNPEEAKLMKSLMSSYSSGNFEGFAQAVTQAENARRAARPSPLLALPGIPDVADVGDL